MNDEYVWTVYLSRVFFYYTGLNTSVPSMIFLKLQQFSSATVLISSGAMGQYYEQHSK